MDRKTFLNILNRVLQLIVFYFLARFLLSLKWNLIWEAVDKFPKAIALTIVLTLSGLALGFVIAVPLALVRALGTPKWLNFLADSYVVVFRGSPLYVQLFLFYYGFGQFGFVQDSFLWLIFGNALICAILVIGLNSGAYACEIFRGALEQIPKGQIEAAEALGLSNRQRNWLVWIPAALRQAIPQYGNEMIFTMHGTALAGLVTINEVFGTAREVNARFYVIYEGMITAAIIYIVLTIILSKIGNMLENRYLKYTKSP